MNHGSPEIPGGTAETAAHAELLDRLGHFAVTPRVIVDLGGEITARSDVLQRRFPDARVLALTFAGTPDAASPREDANGPDKARPWWRKVLAIMTGVPLRAERLPAALDRLPLADGSVDLVLAHWLVPGPPAVDALLAEVRRALAPGGLFLWTTPGPGTTTEHGGTPVLIDMHDLGTALGYAGFVEPVLDIDRFVIHDAPQQAARTADGAHMDAVIREVIHIAAFSGGARRQADTGSDGANETLVPLAAIGRRDRSVQ